MVTIIDEYREPTVGERFGKAFSNLGQAAGREIPKFLLEKENKKQQAIQEKNKQDREDYVQQQKFSHELNLQKEKYGFEDASKASKLRGENQEKIAPLQAGLQAIADMRKIGSKGNLGRGSAIGGYFGGETAKDRAEYEQLGKSIISLASNIPIRNKAEFETLAHNLYDPSLPDSAREGILNAMERIINRSMQGLDTGMDQGTNAMMGNPQQSNKPKPPLTSFHR